MKTENEGSCMKYPGELKECEGCMMNLRQCEIMTLCIPCQCKIWEEYLKGDDNNGNS